jgi:DNA-binding NarL/FixJ family response regulator
MERNRAAAGLFERLANDAQGASTVSAFRAEVIDAVCHRVGADSAAMLDPLDGPASENERSRIAGLGSSAPYADQFIANRPRYAKSLGRYLRAYQHGPVIDSDVYRGRERRRLVAYEELFLPQGASSILASAVRYRCRPTAVIVLKRHGRNAPFRARDAEALEALLPAIALADAGFDYSLGAAQAAPVRGTNWGALSPREAQVAQLASRGMRNGEIAALLGTSFETVKKQLRSVVDKLDVSNRTELAMVWATSGSTPAGASLAAEAKKKPGPRVRRR